jgi:hypothetical protein
VFDTPNLSQSPFDDRQQLRISGANLLGTATRIQDFFEQFPDAKFVHHHFRLIDELHRDIQNPARIRRVSGQTRVGTSASASSLSTVNLASPLQC